MSARATASHHRCRIYDCTRFPTAKPVDQFLAVVGESIYAMLDSCDTLRYGQEPRGFQTVENGLHGEHGHVAQLGGLPVRG